MLEYIFLHDLRIRCIFPASNPTKFMKSKSSLRNLIVLAGSALMAVSSAHAATIFWDGAGADVNWSTLNNWGTDGTVTITNPGGVPTSTDDVVFYSTGGTQLTTNIIDAAFTLQSLTFGNSQAGAVTIGGSSVLTLNGKSGYDPSVLNSGAASGITGGINTGIYVQSGSGAVTISAPITLGGAQQWVNNSVNTLTIQTGALTNGANLLTIGGSGNTTISSSVSSSVGLTKNGAGTLTLSNANSSLSGTIALTAGALQLGNATSMGSSTLTMTSGTTLNLRNDSNTVFTAPINTAPTTGVTYNFDVNNASSAVTNKTLSLGNLTFATNTLVSVTNQINVTGGNNGYILGFGTISAPSTANAGAHPVIINATSAAVTISKFTAGTFGTALTLQGGNSITLSNFEMNSNGNYSITVSGSGTVATLGTTTQTGNRTVGTSAYTLNSGATLNLTQTTSLANIYNSGPPSVPTFTINGGTLNNTSGNALALAANGTLTAGSPTITIGGDFTFGTGSSTSANNLNLGNGAITNAGNRTITFAGTGTTLTMGGIMTNSVGNTQTTTVNGVGNTLSLGGYNLANSVTARTGAFNGSGNVTITGVVANNGGTSNLTYSGTGTLTLSNLNTFTGKLYNGTGNNYVVQVDSGATLKLAAWNYGATGGIGNSFFATTTLLVNGGTITYTNPGAAEAVIDNSGRPITIGTGGATLNAASSALWRITPYTTGGWQNQNIANGLTLTGSGNGQYDKNLTGTGGALTKSGAGTWTLSSAASSYTSTTTIQAGSLVAGADSPSGSAGAFGNASSALILGNASTVASDAPAVLINGAFNVARNITVGTGATTTYNASIGGSNGTGTSTFSGNITLNTGGANYTATLQAATGGTVDFTTGTWTTNNKAIIIGSTGNTGTVKLSNTLTTTGGISVNFGTFLLGSSDRLGDTTPVTVAGGIFDTGTLLTDTVASFNMSNGSLNGTGTITAGTYGLTGGTVNAKLGAGAVTVNTNTVTLGSAGRLNSASTLSVQGGQLTIAGAESVATYQQTGGTLAGTGFTLTSAAAYDMRSGTVSANLGGSVGLDKTTTATVTLSGTNTYTGATTISAGKLSITNAPATSATGTGVVNLSGGTTTTLSGTGISTGLLTVTNASRIAAGINTTGTNGNFGVAGTLSLGTIGGMTLTSANFDFDLSNSAGGVNDLILTGSALSLTGSEVFTFNLLDGLTLDTTTAYTLISGASSSSFASGNFSTWTTNFVNSSNYNATYSFNTNNLQVTFAAIPEPSVALLSALGLLTLLRRRR